VLTPQEAEKLFDTLRVMAAKGLSLIFISHKLHEILAAADRIVVLRGGKVTAERITASTNKNELAELMVGRPVMRPAREAQQPGALVMRAENVCVAGLKPLSDISFELRAVDARAASRRPRQADGRPFRASWSNRYGADAGFIRRIRCCPHSRGPQCRWHGQRHDAVGKFCAGADR
jgi:energy-coupling factor transporter ATP-binding protein EcfA2